MSQTQATRQSHEEDPFGDSQAVELSDRSGTVPPTPSATEARTGSRDSRPTSWQRVKSPAGILVASSAVGASISAGMAIAATIERNSAIESANDSAGYSKSVEAQNSQLQEQISTLQHQNAQLREDLGSCEANLTATAGTAPSSRGLEDLYVPGGTEADGQSSGASELAGVDPEVLDSLAAQSHDRAQ